jgi:hypothetical protein
VSGITHDCFQRCEIAAIGGGADLKINMNEPMISQIWPEELEIHQREENPESGTPARFTVSMAIILRFSFSLFLFIMTLLLCYLISIYCIFVGTTQRNEKCPILFGVAILFLVVIFCRCV